MFGVIAILLLWQSILCVSSKKLQQPIQSTPHSNTNESVPLAPPNPPPLPPGDEYYLNLPLEEKHRTLVYSLPKVGLSLEEDCLRDIYRDELQRDVETLKQLGTRTVFLWCPWVCRKKRVN